MKIDDDTQVIIYFDDPRGQLMQVSQGEYLHYWRLIGWHLQGAAPMLPLEMAHSAPRGVQAGLM